jgi:hypothetical protein
MAFHDVNKINQEAHYKELKRVMPLFPLCSTILANISPSIYQSI